LVTCDNSIHGCDVVVKLESLSLHLQECDHNPKKPVECSNSCGIIVPKDELQVNRVLKKKSLFFIINYFSFLKRITIVLKN
jgi:E3 ubiquitin-protein ligase NRDP1